MKRTILAMIVTISALGITAPADASPEIHAVTSSAVPVAEHHTDARVHHNDRVVINGMTRHELDTHPNGG